MSDLEALEIISEKTLCIRQQFKNTEYCIDDFGYTFGDLRAFILPIPKRGRANRVLRDYFFDKNEKGHWVRKNHVEDYMKGTPSSPEWKIEVLPILIDLLKKQYGGDYEISTWIIEASIESGTIKEA